MTRDIFARDGTAVALGDLAADVQAKTAAMWLFTDKRREDVSRVRGETWSVVSHG